MSDDYVRPADLRAQLASENPPLVIDVRNDDEYAAGHIPNALHIPGDQLPNHLDELPRNRAIVAY
jgi:rhodanese-related sulfurtransferase